MNCIEIKNRLSEYIDDEITPEMKTMIDTHLEKCPDCQKHLTKIQALHKDMVNISKEKLPFGFLADFKDKLTFEKRKNPKIKPLFHRAWVRISAGLAACLILLVGAISVITDFQNSLETDKVTENFDISNGSDVDIELVTPEYDRDNKFDIIKTDNQNESVEDSSISRDKEINEENLNNPDSFLPNVERKIIKNVSLSLKVEDFDSAFFDIESLANQYGGYVVSGEKYTSGDDLIRRGYISLRVNAEQLDLVISEIKNLGTVENINISTDDITIDYYDLEARLIQYETQRDRLLTFYDQAKNIDELISLESEVNRIQAEIESLMSTIKLYDQLTDLSTITINLFTSSTYSTKVKPQGFTNFGANIQSAFLNGFNSLLDFLAKIFTLFVRFSPWLIITGIIIVVLIILRGRRRKKQKKD